MGLTYTFRAGCQPGRLRPSAGFAWAVGLLVFAAIYLTSWYSYLLFHCVVETFSILVSFSIFLFAFNTLRFSRQRYLTVLGIAYLFVGGFDLVHMLAYKGMGVMAVDGSNHATQTWIAARYMESISLLAVMFLFHRKVDYRPVMVLYFLVSAGLFLVIFVFPVFPDCFIEGRGLTPFKVISEYLICCILVAAGIVLYQRRNEVDPVIFKFLLASLAATVASELAFTNYISVYGPANLIGHMLKLISSYLIYRAIVARGLLAPYQSMFRELAQSQKELERYSRYLESRVAERTRELEKSNRNLRHLSRQLVSAEEKERRRIARDLHDSIGQSLSAIKLSVENAVSGFSHRLENRELQEFERIVSMAKTAIQEMRRIIVDLRPPALENGILHAIETVCRDFNRLHPRIRLQTRLSATEDCMPEEIKIIVFRLLQELLNNIGKHSHAGQVEVILAVKDDELQFEVADDGRGFNPDADRADSPQTGFGLVGMRERAELSGARFQVHTRRGGGTRVQAAWSLSKTAGQAAAVR